MVHHNVNFGQQVEKGARKGVTIKWVFGEGGVGKTKGDGCKYGFIFIF